MIQLIGIDEAGYGPNLGPFIMTAVTCRVPESLANADLWDCLSTAVCRSATNDDERILVDDSKVVYASGKGLRTLEEGVHILLQQATAISLSQFLEKHGSEEWIDLKSEHWFEGNTDLPLEAELVLITERLQLFQQCCAQHQIEWGQAYVEIVCPPRFNTLTEQSNSKGAVLAYTLQSLIRRICKDNSYQSHHFVSDKHGGRNTYAAILQEGVNEGIVLAEMESAECSRYRVHGIDKEICFTFKPRADASNLCVAAASMISKYLREVLMLEFNQFWKKHLPELRPTAGYPVDAGRFLDEIRSTMNKLGIDKSALWRNR